MKSHKNERLNNAWERAMLKGIAGVEQPRKEREDIIVQKVSLCCANAPSVQ